MSNSIEQASDIIVVDIADPNESQPAALEAARAIVRDGSVVYLYHRVFHESIGEAVFDPRDELLDQARHLVLEARRAQLTALGETLPNVRVIAHTSWTQSRWQSLLAFAAKNRATTVVVQSSQPARWRPLTPPNTDWQLIRHCPTPLLIARPHCHRPYRQVVAAVDPLHAGDKPAELDHRILQHAAKLALAHRARLSILNVVAPVGSLASPAAVPACNVDSTSAHQIEAHQAAVRRLAANLDYRNVTTTVIPGSPAQEIVDHTAGVEADLVVMGAVSRSTLRHLLIGSTAEKVLDRLTADTLIVKPALPRADVQRSSMPSDTDVRLKKAPNA